MNPNESTSSSSEATSIDQMRQNYTMGGLHVKDVDANPVVQFQRWFSEVAGLDGNGEPVANRQIPEWFEANAMTLSTTDGAGHVTSRVVLLKGIEKGQFVFYTNYDSAKARQLDRSPSVSLCFYWAPLQRQVRIEGHVSKISRSESEAYFHTRPRGSQLGAHVSEQSCEIASRSVLESAMQGLEDHYGDDEIIPIPDHWGGYSVEPVYFEFWQGRSSRLHDRIVYRRRPDGWQTARIAP
ncbi:MAG: pyridoxamine 5'-phosphate oxidase [Planctomycetota bacterium]